MGKNVTIVGLGYVGLPLAVAIAEAGLSATGLDMKESVIDDLQRGVSHVDDVSSETVEKLVQCGQLSLTLDADTAISSADVVVVCVPTPLSDEQAPDLSAIKSVAAMLSTRLKPGSLVLLESTTYPGTTDELVKPILEKAGLRLGHDFFLAFSPERVDPGNATFGIVNTPKVVGGVDSESTTKAVDFYKIFVEEVVAARSAREAEMSKLLENTYRHINIALVNEMAKFCHELSIDIWNVIECASTKPFGYQAFFPGPGVGGHCIPIDPNYLSHTVKTRLHYPFRFVELAQEINNSMPTYILRRIQDNLNARGKPLRGSRVRLLGVTYKAGVSDERESPAIPLAQRLILMGAELSYHDPFVSEWRIGEGAAALDVPRVDDLWSGVNEADITVLLQGHPEYMSRPIQDENILDTRGVLKGDHVDRL